MAEAEVGETGTGPWLIFPDQAGVAELVAERLRAAGQPGSVLPSSAIDPADGFAGLAWHIAALSDAPSGLIHLGPLGRLGVDPQPTADTDQPGEGTTSWDEYLTRACGPLLTAPAALNTAAGARAAGAGQCPGCGSRPAVPWPLPAPPAPRPRRPRGAWAG